jgi:ribosomal subunit interface protein
MEIRVSGHQVNTGDALKSHVEDRLHAIADKYFSRSISAHVTFGRGQHGNGFCCDIVAHVMQGVILKGSGQAMEAHPAFDQAADRIETQLRRYMRRLKSRSVTPAADLAVVDESAGYTVFEVPRGDDGDGEPDGEAPVIIAETRVDVPDASVSDAVMMLDLRNTTALLFRNSGTGTFNMVYRRTDGTIGWVEPSRMAQ